MRQEPWEKTLENIAFWKHLGIQVEHIEDGRAALRLPFKAALGQYYANMHGGALAALLDAAGAVALLSVVGNRTVNTVELKINYLKPVTPDQTGVTAHGTVARAGKSIGVCTVEVKNDDDALVATGIATYMVMPDASSGRENRDG